MPDLSDKLTLKDSIRGWLKTIKKTEHFYMEDDPFGFHINCKCPTSLRAASSSAPFQNYSGVSFIWSQGNQILTRPEGFWMGGVPLRSINICDPQCFVILESTLHKLHDFFEHERFNGQI